MGNEKYFGKYRGTVVNNIDPEQRGRMVVMVPDVHGINPSNWAEACVPYAGQPGPSTDADKYPMPPIGTAVWVEFENGEADFPVWVGCRWTTPSSGNATTPGVVSTSGNIVLQTTGQHTMILSDLPGPTGGIILKSPDGASIIVNDAGIYIQNGKGASISMVGPSVTINNGALAIT